MDQPGEEKKPEEREFSDVISRYPDYNKVFSLAWVKAGYRLASIVTGLKSLLSGLR